MITNPKLIEILGEKNKNKSLSELRQAIWEASQFASTEAIYDFINEVCAEIEKARSLF